LSVPSDVVHGPVDAIDVVEVRKIWQVGHEERIVASPGNDKTTDDPRRVLREFGREDPAGPRAFYEKLGFEVVGGDPAQNWLILRNGTATIGLFQGIFERNILTFNPGWDDKAQAVEEFTDVREHQRRLRSKGLELKNEADESSTGPASFVVIDPDGNPVLIDQHV
jgi:lactoylglutathione lyase